jgi:DNA polymerase-4
MPTAQALRLCPDAIVVPPRGAHYAEVSARVFEIFRRYTPLVEGLSLDEAFLDVTGSRNLFGDGEAIAARIKDDIRRELALTASAGVAPCKFAAKIASDLRKPDGLCVVGQDVAGFLAPLPIERMWGVGPTAAERLRTAGYETIGDLAVAGSERLERLLGSWGAQVAALSRGEDGRPVEPERAAKSIGQERTLQRDIRTRAELERELLQHSAAVARRLARAGLWASVVRIKVKYADFVLRSRQTSLPTPVFDTDALYAAARELLGELPARREGVRLVGVTAAELSKGPAQGSLFHDHAREKRERVQQVTVAVQERFGVAGLTRASLLGGESESPPQRTETRRDRRR